MLISFVQFVNLIKIIKKDILTKNKENINGKQTKFKEQQDQYEKCNKKFEIYNNSLIKDNKTIFKRK